jgi:hypothetical protein
VHIVKGNRKKRIGIITWHYYMNFGSALQTYALSNTLSNMGFAVEIINYRNPRLWKSSSFFDGIISFISDFLYDFLRKRKGHKYYVPFSTFRKKYFRETKRIADIKGLKKIANRYSLIVCGSDQIWAPNVFNPIYMLSFIDGKKIKKVSYAASIGLRDIPEELVNTYKTLLLDFSSISVREEEAAVLLNHKCDISKISVVLDPTLLIEVDDYRRMERKVNIQEKFIFCYFLNKDHEYEFKVKSYAESNGCKIIGWSAKTGDTSWMGEYKWIGPREFLWLIENSEAVMTDSYHGTIFSLLFHKIFFVFERFKASDPINQNSRIYQLDAWFDISKRIVKQTDSLSPTNFNYDTFDKRLSELKERSFEFIRKAVD